MNLTVIIIYLLIQLSVQYIMYKVMRDLLFRVHAKFRNTIPWLKAEFFIINIIISLLVLVFTGRGGVTGMTNTFASVILGLIMAMDYNFYVRDIISGLYYKNLEKELIAREKQKARIALLNSKYR